MYFASAATIQRGQKGKNKALHYTDKVRHGRQGEALLGGVFSVSLPLSLFFFFPNHENSKLGYVKAIATGHVKSPMWSYVTCQAKGKYQYHNTV